MMRNICYKDLYINDNDVKTHKVIIFIVCIFTNVDQIFWKVHKASIRSKHTHLLFFNVKNARPYLRYQVKIAELSTYFIGVHTNDRYHWPEAVMTEHPNVLVITSYSWTTSMAEHTPVFGVHDTQYQKDLSVTVRTHYVIMLIPPIP